MFQIDPNNKDIKQRKQNLRKELLHRRQVIPADLQDTTRWKVINHLRSVLSETKAGVIALYIPMEQEIDITPLAKELWRDGITVCLPRVVQRKTPLVFNVWKENDTLEPDILGLPAAPGVEIIPKLICIPAVGYSKQGYRLGYGGGYYDMTLQELQNDSLSAIICQTELEVTGFPKEYHDQQADYVVTGKELITCRV